ncbi:MAG: potassium transporter TrkG [bacterium]
MPGPLPLPPGEQRAARALAGLPPLATGVFLTLGWALLPLFEARAPGDLGRAFGLDGPTAVTAARAAAAGLIVLTPLAMALARRAPRLATTLVGLAVALATAALTVTALDAPIRFLLAAATGMVGLAAVLGWFRVPPELADLHRRPAADATLGAVCGAGLTWGLVLAAGMTAELGGRVAVAGAAGSAAGWLLLRAAGGPVRVRALAAAALAAAALPLVPALDATLLALPALALLCVAALAARRLVPRRGRPERGLPAPPAAALVAGTFLLGAFIGAAFLALPAASHTGIPLRFIDALFTSFSAICVTGLVVVDTATALSGFGQAVVLVLIQLGGLGIMTFSTAAILLLGRRMSLSHEITVASLVEAGDRARLADQVRLIIGVTVLCEAIGALLLTALFAHGGDSFGAALWRGVFTAISAFCNAGFALQTDSLMPYAQAPAVLLVTALLIVLGGLGPLLIAAVATRRRPFPISARLALVATAALIAIGFLAFTAFEWDRTLGPLSTVDKLVNALFQSITLRTAGFNSIDLAATHPATYTVMIPLMYIGGCPGSTAGGVKTTTIAILVLLVRAAFRDAAHIEVYGHQIAPGAIRKATAVTFVGAGSAVLLLLALLATQPMTLEIALFEAVSALGTVGLSIGGTALLDEVGKIMIALAMFAGRVGPLTLLLVLAGRIDPRPPVKRPLTDVAVG